MRTYVLFGHTASPGYAGDSVALAVVTARDIESAARKLKGAVCEVRRHRKESRIFSPSKRTTPIIRRIVASMLREMMEKRPEPYQVEQWMSRYSSFRIERKFRIR